MDDQARIALIRRGNELFNNGDLKNSLKIFLSTNYNDGIIRVADVLYFDKKDKISAVKLYKRANHKKVLDDFAEKAAAVIRTLLQEDKRAEEEEKLAREFEQKLEKSGQKIEKWEPVVLSADQIAGIKEIGGPKKDEGKNKINGDKK